MNANLTAATSAVAETSKRDQIAEGLRRLTLAAGTACSARMLAEQHDAPDVAALASICQSLAQDGHEGALSHAADGDDIGVEDALGLINRAIKASTSLLDAIRMMADSWSAPLFQPSNVVALMACSN